MAGLEAKDGWKVIDLHTVMKKSLAKKRDNDPKFKYSRDGVHPEGRGMNLWLNRSSTSSPSASLKNPHPNAYGRMMMFPRERMRKRDAQLTETGHKRPMRKGKPWPKPTRSRPKTLRSRKSRNHPQKPNNPDSIPFYETILPSPLLPPCLPCLAFGAKEKPNALLVSIDDLNDWVGCPAVTRKPRHPMTTAWPRWAPCLPTGIASPRFATHPGPA